MKILKKSLVLLLAISIIASLCSCYTISAQKLDNVKGTYKLTHYTYTPSYERKDGYTPTHRNYITDEKYLYEDYLIVTGSNTGYYVHKAKDTEAYKGRKFICDNCGYVVLSDATDDFDVEDFQF